MKSFFEGRGEPEIVGFLGHAGVHLVAVVEADYAGDVVGGAVRDRGEGAVEDGDISVALFFEGKGGAETEDAGADDDNYLILVVGHCKGFWGVNNWDRLLLGEPAL